MSLSVRNTRLQTSDLQAGNLSELINLSGLKVVSGNIPLPINAATASYGNVAVSSSTWLLPLGNVILGAAMKPSVTMSSGGAATFAVSLGTTAGASLTTRTAAAITALGAVTNGIVLPPVLAATAGVDFPVAANNYVYLTIGVAALTSAACNVNLTILIVNPTPFDV